MNGSPLSSCCNVFSVLDVLLNLHYTIIASHYDRYYDNVKHPPQNLKISHYYQTSRHTLYLAVCLVSLITYRFHL